MDVVGGGEVLAGKHERSYWVVEDKSEREDPLLVCVETSNKLQVYRLFELLERDYDEMEFVVEDTCECCKNDSTDCATRLAHPLKDIDLPLTEFTGEPPTAMPEYICKDCVKEIADEIDRWVHSNKEELVSVSL